MYNEKELEIIQDFLKKYPDISELHLDIISCIAGTVIELKRENPEELSRIELYGKNGPTKELFLMAMMGLGFPKQKNWLLKSSFIGYCG